MNNRPLLAITMGDSAGIGPEVVAKTLIDASIYDKCNPFVIGNTEAMCQAFSLINSDVSIRRVSSVEEINTNAKTVDVLDLGNLDFEKIEYGQISAESGKASVEWILKAGELAASGQIQAICTAPINKEACNLAGHKDIGHMEIFQSQTGVSQVATMLMTGTLRVVHLTTHRSLRIACDYVTRDNVLAKISLTHDYFQKWGFPNPRIGVSALMLPHGYSKLMQFFSGDEIQFADPIGIGATGSLALAVFSEFICSVLIILGLGTRLAAIPLVITMLVAVFIVHAADGMSHQELPLLYLFSYVLLMLTGSGKYSLDHYFLKK